MTDASARHLYHGGHKGAEAEFGRAAEAAGIPETTISFDGHKMERAKNVETLTAEELAKGRVSMEFVFQRMGRRFARGKGLLDVIHSMFHVVTRSDHLFAVGWIQPDKTVKGGTGWAVELAKLFNRKLHVFDQERHGWYEWVGNDWSASVPTLPDGPFSGTGTRHLTDEGKKAIHDLVERS